MALLESGSLQPDYWKIIAFEWTSVIAGRMCVDCNLEKLGEYFGSPSAFRRMLFSFCSLLL